MNKYLVAAVVFAGVALSGCATEDLSYAAAKRAAVAKDGEPELLTGTRLGKPTTERVVKGVGNNEYNETNKHTSIGNTVGAKSN